MAPVERITPPGKRPLTDILDISYGLVCCAAAPATWGLSLLAIPTLAWLRRSTGVAEWVVELSGGEPEDFDYAALRKNWIGLDTILLNEETAALAAPKKDRPTQETSQPVAAPKNAPVQPRNEAAREGASQAVATAKKPALAADDGLGRAVEKVVQGTAKGSDAPPTMASAINALPKLVLLSDLQPYPASPTAVPLGIDWKGNIVWGDLLVDLLHIGIYATSGAGKDALLRAWFALLTNRNSPDELLFAFLDGKGDWLTPDLADLACMFIRPAGGYGKKGKEALLAAIKAVDEEAGSRQEIIFGSGARTREQYNRQAVTEGKKPLPLLVVVATDVMDGVTGEVEELLSSLVSKARALGIRVVASMQTPTGKGLDWRMNLSSVLAGALVDGSQDGPALGVRETSTLPFRPSKIPPPPQVRGVFVAKVRGEFTLLRTPVFRADSEANEDRFNEIVASLPKKTSQATRTAWNEDAQEDNGLLTGLLANATSVKQNKNRLPGKQNHLPEVPPLSQALPELPKLPEKLTKTQKAARVWTSASPAARQAAKKALQLMDEGAGKQTAIEEAFGYANGRNYTNALPVVEAARILRSLLNRTA